jgi:hypothetical protein
MSSTQNPEVHSLPVWHLSPLGKAAHATLVQSTTQSAKAIGRGLFT